MQKDLISAEITGLSHDGRGIAHINGKTTFIEGALPGETVIFAYLRKHRRFDEAQVVEVRLAAPERVLPKCEHFTICGGCSLQHMHPDAQIAMKQATLLEQLQHFAHVQPDILLPPLKGDSWGYRHKARLGVRYVYKKERLLIGFREKNGRYLADIRRCEVLNPKVGFLLEDLRTQLAALDGYDHIPQIEVAISDSVTALVIRHMKPLNTSDQGKLCKFAEQHDVQIYLQPGGIETIHLLSKNAAPLSYKIPEYNLEFIFHPTDFIQVNVNLNRQMVKYVMGLLDPQPTDRILDLFCGLGNFTLPIARHSQSVIGVEGDQKMVERAIQNAQHNQIQNTEFYVANLYALTGIENWMQGSFDKILLDPPRTGALELIPHLPKLKAGRIVYVSCNPATLARDAKELTQYGYHLAQAGVIDMFPHTSHVESVAVFERRV